MNNRIATLRDGRRISDDEKPYVIAEVNTSHFGNEEIARELIDRAADAGCDCVKFQSWSDESLYSRSFYDQNPIAKRIVKKFSLSPQALASLSRYCSSKGVAFSSTPYSRAEVDFLVDECNAPFVKIASMELNHLPFLRYVAGTGIPIVLSTGMGEMSEIRRAVATIEDVGNTNICILHCVSIYPPEPATIRLRNILGLRKAFPRYPIGYSDHSIGTEMAAAATALGASVIEKHLTLDSKKIGMDNQMAAEPATMTDLVSQCHKVHAALGGTRRIIGTAERQQRLNMRRSAVYTRDLRAGTHILAEHLSFKRPGTGIPPEAAQKLEGRLLLRDVMADTLVSYEDLISLDSINK
jgi:sialic acid synthase SpsE